MLVVHYVAHRTNMVMQILSNQPLVQKIKALTIHLQLLFFFTQEAPWIVQACYYFGNKGEQGIAKCENKVDFNVVSYQEGP
jgi:hypothetical protein